MRVIKGFFGIVFVFLLLSFTRQEKIWLDKNLNKTTQTKAVYYRVDKKLQGQVSFYFKNTAIYRKTFFSEGKLDGKFNEFYSTGELKVDGKYKNGKKEGNWKTYYKNGKIESKGRYHQGEKVGVWKFFYKND